MVKMQAVVVQAKQIEEDVGLHPDSIQSVSCVNLRKEDGTTREVQERIEIHCTLCNKTKYLGKDSSSLVSLSFASCSEILCDRCMDIFTEVGVFGTKVLVDSERWEMSSQVTRVACIAEDMKCFRCDKIFDSHIYVKYYDVSRMDKKGRQRPTHFLKVCGVCTSEMLGWIRQSGVTCDKKSRFKLKDFSKFGSGNKLPIRRWVQ